MKKRDFILILAILLISLTGWAFTMPKAAGTTAEVYKGDVLYGSYSLNEDRIITVECENGILNTIEIKDGRVRMKEATCPNGTCGWIEKRGESICCAPAGLLIIINDPDGGYDAVTK